MPGLRINGRTSGRIVDGVLVAACSEVLRNGLRPARHDVDV